MRQIYVMVGLPGSGKTTLVNKAFPGAVVVSSDNLIEERAKELGKTYDEVFGTENFDSKFWEIAEQEILFGDPKKNLVIDRTNLSPKARRRIMDTIRRSLGLVQVTAVVFNPPADRVETEIHNHILSSRDGKTIPVNVIENMKRSFVMPRQEEGFHNIIVMNPSYTRN